jgi:hypothetical protein
MTSLTKPMGVFQTANQITSQSISFFTKLLIGPRRNDLTPSQLRPMQSQVASCRTMHPPSVKQSPSFPYWPPNYSHPFPFPKFPRVTTAD